MRPFLTRHFSSLLLTLFLAVPLLMAQSLTLSGYTGNPFIDGIVGLVTDCLGFDPGVACLFVGDAPAPDGPEPLSAVRLEANLGQTDARYPFLARGKDNSFS